MIRIAGRFILLCCLAALFTVTGCSERSSNESTGNPKKWVCDKEADEVMKRENYKRGISLHERFLRKEPDNAIAIYHLGYALGQIGDLRGEVSCDEQAIAYDDIGVKN